LPSVTVHEIHTHFDLDDPTSPAISGFLRRIYQGPFRTCHYRVTRIEKMIFNTQYTRMIKGYFVTRRPGLWRSASSSSRAPPAQTIGNINARDSTIIEQEAA